jgi:hypothetical protein
VRVKAFLVYTLLRLVLLVTTFVVVLGSWKVIRGGAEVTSNDIFFSIIVAFVLSGIA